MSKKTNKLFLFAYMVLSIFIMEFVLRLRTVGQFFSVGIVISLIFTIPIASIVLIFVSFFQNRFQRILVAITLLLLGVVFASQLVYYNIFQTFYTIYSVKNSSQVIGFWRDILTFILSNLHWIIILLLPAIMLLFMKSLSFEFKTKKTVRVYLAALALVTHLTGIMTIHVGGKGANSPFDLYYNNYNPILSMNHLGLVTTMRIDMQRFFTGWSPHVDVFIPEPPEEPPREIEYNIMNIDFEYLKSNENNKDLLTMHQYFSSVRPTAKNDFTGKYEGYNLVLITAEAFSPFAVHKDITPTLYKLVNEGYNFSNFYVPIWDVSTSDGEYVALTGLIPKSRVWSFKESAAIDLPFVMGNQLKNLGYKTVAYHNHNYRYYARDKSHPNMGYIYKGIGNGLDVRRVWPASDLEMLQKTTPEYINDEPFHAYYMTVSGHLQYNFTGNSMAAKNRKYVENLPFSNQARAYLATQIELDKALEHLLDELEKAGVAERTLIALSADHYPYGLDDDVIDEFAGGHLERNFELYRSNFILYTKGMEPLTVDKPCSSLDIIPTLSNLLGLEFDSRLLMGTDIFSDADPLVIFRNHSFITDKGRYNSVTQEFIPNDGVMVNEQYVETIKSIVETKFFMSARILETDYYNKVLNAVIIEESQ